MRRRNSRMDGFAPLYESYATESAEATIRVTGVAELYERVHFIGHALYSPDVKKEDLMAQAEAIEADIEERTGYKSFIVDIKIKHFPPFMTDIDYILDVPVTSPLAPLTLIAIIAAIGAIIGWIIYLFWTTWIQYEKIYPCDQCAETPRFEGWLLYRAHLTEKHPEKEEAIEEAGGYNWWEEVPSMVKWIVGGLVAVGVIGVTAELVRRYK